MGRTEQAGTTNSKQQKRQNKIVDVVVEEGSVRIEALAEMFRISLMTVHRDLDELQAKGLLRKSRGQATAMSSSLVESSDVYRISQQASEKKAIAKAAIRLVEPGQSLMLDDSTTAAQMASYLEEKKPLTVITNALGLMNRLSNSIGISLVAIGGTYFNWASAFMGGTSSEAISRLRADVYFMSSSAVIDGHCFHQSEESVATKRAMFEASSKRILMVDHTKFERRALHAVMPVDEFDHVIVDSQTPKEVIESLKDRGLDVIVASSTSD